MYSIQSILSQDGPMLSGLLAKKYEELNNSTNDAARKAISRARSPVQKLKCFPFDKNQVFCYLEEHFNTSLYKDCLYHALKENSATISPMLIALENNHGIIPENLLPIYSCSPIINTKGHRLFSRCIKDLIDQEIVLLDDGFYMLKGGTYSFPQNLTQAKSMDRMRKIIVNDFISWAIKLNFIAYNSAIIYPEIAEFLHYQWCATCPSYIQPLFDSIHKKPGFMIVDIIYGKQTTIADVSFFVSKINTIRHFKNAPNFIPVLLVESLTNEALMLLKEHKIFIGILQNIFDKNYTSTLYDIYNVFLNATSILRNDVSKIDTLLENIYKNEGRFNNVIGDLFEYMVGAFYQRLGVSYIEMNKLIPNSKGTKNEMDILLCKDNKIIVIECKATKSPVTLQYVEKWLSEILPTFRHWIQEKYPQRKCEFQIWSMGGYDDKSLLLLETHKKSAKKYELHYYDKPQIVNLAKQNGDSTFLEHIAKHFKNF